MPSGYDIWGFIAGILGTIGLLPIIFAIANNQLPSSKFKLLCEIMAETESLFRAVVEEGLLRNPSYIVQIEAQLSGMRFEVEDLRAATHRATSLFKELKALFHGLSRHISMLCGEVKELRAEISEASSKERKRLLSLASINDMQHPTSTQATRSFSRPHTSSTPSVHHGNHTENSYCDLQPQSTPQICAHISSNDSEIAPHLPCQDLRTSLNPAQNVHDLAEIGLNQVFDISTDAHLTSLKNRIQTSFPYPGNHAGDGVLSTAARRSISRFIYRRISRLVPHSRGPPLHNRKTRVRFRPSIVSQRVLRRDRCYFMLMKLVQMHCLLVKSGHPLFSLVRGSIRKGDDNELDMMSGTAALATMNAVDDGWEDVDGNRLIETRLPPFGQNCS